MSFTEKRLCNPTQLTTSGQTLYTVPASKTAIIKQIVVTNVTGSVVTFSLFIGSAATPNALFSGTSVAANDTVIINLSQVLSQNEILTSLASANSSLNITISGVENDGPLNPLSTYIADGAITSAKIADGAILNADINASAAIDKTKISGTAVTAADTGTVTSTMILDGTIVNADINTAAAIDITKVSSTYSATRFPSFHAYMSGANGACSNNGVMVFNTTLTNNQSGYSTSTGRFTCPSGQAGVYVFNVNANVYNIGSTGQWTVNILQYNSSNTNIAFCRGTYSTALGATDSFSNSSAVLTLAAGDYVVCTWTVPASGLYSAGITYNSFQGARIQ